MLLEDGVQKREYSPNADNAKDGSGSQPASSSYTGRADGKPMLMSLCYVLEPMPKISANAKKTDKVSLEEEAQTRHLVRSQQPLGRPRSHKSFSSERPSSHTRIRKRCS